MIPSERQEQILRWLQDEQTLTIDDLIQRLDVSIMTVHRDVNALVKSGQAEKVHGGVTLPTVHTAPHAALPVCRLCGIAAPERTKFIISTQRGQQFFAGTAYCGILLMHQTPDVISAMAKDFLHGRMINARDAVYLIESEVALSCTPSTLVFATKEDAQKFQTGFEGQLMDFEQARDYLINYAS